MSDVSLQIVYSIYSFRYNFEGFFKNDYITEEDYRWITDEIDRGITDIESKLDK